MRVRPPVLRLAGVAKSYGAVRALLPTDLEVADGGTTALIGPSGSGKTTLLRLMIGLTRPDAGG
jgi:ABC-type sugar transport system ATPase subunit